MERLDTIPIIGHLFALDTIIANVFETIISGEPHPTTAARVLTQISILGRGIKESRS